MQQQKEERDRALERTRMQHFANLAQFHAGAGPLLLPPRTAVNGITCIFDRV